MHIVIKRFLVFHAKISNSIVENVMPFLQVDVLPTMEEKEASTVLASLSSVDTSVDTKTQYLMQDKDKKVRKTVSEYCRITSNHLV